MLNQPISQITIQTERIKLFPLSLEHLSKYLEMPEELEENWNMKLSRDIFSARLREVFENKILKMHELERKFHIWYTYWLIYIKELNFGAGLIGFKSIPNELGETEISYGIDSTAQKKGYVTEASNALIHWAFNFTDCKIITAQASKTNIASHRVLEKVGMSVTSEGPENISYKIEKNSFNFN